MSEWIIRPYPLSETFFAERLRGCDYACSAEVYSRLRDVDVIDAHGFAKWHKCENCWCAALRSPFSQEKTARSSCCRRSASRCMSQSEACDWAE